MIKTSETDSDPTEWWGLTNSREQLADLMASRMSLESALCPDDPAEGTSLNPVPGTSTALAWPTTPPLSALSHWSTETLAAQSLLGTSL